MTEQDCIAEYVASRERAMVIDLAALRRDAGALWSEAFTTYADATIANHPEPLREPIIEMTRRVIARLAN